MILKSITPYHFGPFSSPTTISIEDEVTVLTGGNDVGKSYGLLAIESFFSRISAKEEHVNVDRLWNQSKPWKDDVEVKIQAVIQVDERTVPEKYLTGQFRPGDEITVEWILTNTSSSGHKLIQVIRGKSKIRSPGARLSKLPNMVTLPNEMVRSVIELDSMGMTETALLKVGFGPQFNVSSLRALSPEMRDAQISRAEETLNDRLKDIFPPSMPMKLKIRDIGAECKQFSINLTDAHKGHVPVGGRGTGVQKLLTLLGVLMQVDTKEHTIILLDEPENSLHADAQHSLRIALETLASKDNIQVVYATHSPSMINPVKPETIRVFSRENVNGHASVKIDNQAYGDNFQRVRISLGLTPSDSLLYGSVSVIVEGDTEVRCLDQVLAKLAADKVDGFEVWNKLVSECHFICGEGNNIAKYCRIADSQNGLPVVLLDGDKPNTAEEIKQINTDIPVLNFPERVEFEQIVPQERYIAAVKSCLSADISERLDQNEFDAWIEGKEGLRKNQMFSKQVEHWVTKVGEAGYNKHKAMEAAIKQTPSDEINTDTLKELVAAISARLHQKNVEQ